MNNVEYIKLFNDVNTTTDYLLLIYNKRLKSRINKYPDSYFINLYLRILINIQSSVLLLKKNKKNHHHIASIMLIIRSGILDCLHLYYLGSFLNIKENNLENQTDLIEEIKRINCNQVGYLIEDLKFTYDKSRIKESHLKYFKNNCKECFEKMIDINLDYELKKSYKKGISSKELVNKSMHKDVSMNLYTQYSIFSKYEHNGEFSKPIFDMSESNYKKELGRIFICFGYFFEAIMSCSTFMFFNSPKEIEKVKQKCNKIQNLIIPFILDAETSSA